MKLATETRKLVASEGVPQSASFTIKASAKAFEILSAGLYSDKIKAILRELGANAHDSHVAANKTSVPFMVHLPNALEPEFWIRDYGTGLSHENTVTLYTTYFESNKTNSNDFIGCLGLGSKSPFSYTDNFTVTSWFDGKKSIYNCHLDTTGMPSIVRLKEIDTNEPAGVEVRFGVKKENFNEFVEKARIVYRWFVNRPTVVGASITFPADEYIMQKPGLFRLKKRYSYEAQSQVIMGNIAYPLPNYLPDFNLNEHQQGLIRHGLELFLSLGDVDVTPSREALQYTKRTVSAIKLALDKTIGFIRSETKRDIENQPTSWDARSRFCEMRKIGILREYLPKDSDFKWRGNSVPTYMRFTENNGPVSSFTLGQTKFACLCYGYERMSVHGGSFKKNWNRQQPVILEPSKDLKFFLEDTGSEFLAGKRVKYYMEQNNLGKDCFIFENDAFSKKFIKKEEIEHLLVKISTMPDPPKVTAVSRKQKTKTAQALVFSWCNSPQRAWNPKEVDLSAPSGGVYVEVKRYGWQSGTLVDKYAPLCRTHHECATKDSDGYGTAFLLNCLLKEFEPVGLVKPTTLFGFRQELLKDVEANPQWTRLEDHLKAYVATLTNDPVTLARRRAIIGFYETHIEKYNNASLRVIKNGEYQDGSLMKEFLSNFGDVVDGILDTKAVSISRLLNRLSFLTDVEIKSDPISKEIEKAYSSIFSTYPMISIVDHHKDTPTIKPYLIDYVKLVDASL